MFTMGVAEGRNVLVLPSASASASSSTSSAFGPISGQSFETSLQRVHIVSFGGETYRAATPLDGPASRIVFDPLRHRFVELLPSIRVELAGAFDLDAIAASLDAVRVTAFESLGFAIVELPETLHPADALRTLASLANPPAASLRMRGPPIRWR